MSTCPPGRRSGSARTRRGITRKGRSNRRWTAGQSRTRSTPGTAPSTRRRSSSTSRTCSAASWHLVTIQVDTWLPERFEPHLRRRDGAEHRPVMIHRAILGSLERFIAIYRAHRRRLPALAGAGAGDRAADHGSNADYAARSMPRSGARSARRSDAQRETELQDPRSGTAEDPLMLVVGTRKWRTGPCAAPPPREKGAAVGRPRRAFVAELSAAVPSDASRSNPQRRKPASDSPSVERAAYQRRHANQRAHPRREIRVVDEDGTQRGVMTPSRRPSGAPRSRLWTWWRSPRRRSRRSAASWTSASSSISRRRRPHESKKKQKIIQVKEVKFRPNIDEHDYDFKLKNALRFLEEGDKVKVTVQFRGREMARQDLGHKLLRRLADDLGEGAVLESSPEMAGNRMHVIFGPPRHVVKKPSSADSPPGKQEAV